jgi:hypothetical protein
MYTRNKNTDRRCFIPTREEAIGEIFGFAVTSILSRCRRGFAWLWTVFESRCEPFEN